MKPYILCVLSLVGVLSMARADESPTTIRLQMQNKQAVLAGGVQQQLRQQAMDLVESSNFHSGPGGENQIFTSAGVQQDYRDSVSSGDYLLVAFPTPQKIKTLGGEITAAEIVIGLHQPGGQNSLFTIDDIGRVVGHAKYAGEICLRLKKTVAQAQP